MNRSMTAYRNDDLHRKGILLIAPGNTSLSIWGIVGIGDIFQFLYWLWFKNDMPVTRIPGIGLHAGQVPVHPHQSTPEHGMVMGAILIPILTGGGGAQLNPVSE